MDAEERRLLRHVNKKMPENIPEYKNYNEDGKWHLRVSGFPHSAGKPVIVRIGDNPEKDKRKVIFESRPPTTKGVVINLPQQDIVSDPTRDSSDIINPSDSFHVTATHVEEGFEFEKSFNMASGSYIVLKFAGNSVQITQQAKPFDV